MYQRYEHILYESKNIKITNGHRIKLTPVVSNNKSKQGYTMI